MKKRVIMCLSLLCLMSVCGCSKRSDVSLLKSGSKLARTAIEWSQDVDAGTTFKMMDK